jgi:hypothetical protein
MMAACWPTKEETGKEDHCDDEQPACDDTHPGHGLIQAIPSSRANVVLD